MNDLQDQLDITTKAKAVEPKVYPRWHIPDPDDYPEVEEYKYQVIMAYANTRASLLTAIIMLDTIMEQLEKGHDYPVSIIETFLKQFRQ